jgi:plastocyanin
VNDVDRGERAGRLPGVAYPLIAVVLGGILVWSFSRILLAVGKDEAVVISSLVSLNILVGAALVAYGRRVRNRPVALPFLLGAAGVVVAVGVVAAVAFGDRPPTETEAGGGGPKPERVSLTASGTTFLETKLTLTAGAKVSMSFDNKDAGLQHNFALFDGKDASAPALFHSPLVTGPATATFTFTAPSKPGSYFFHCDVHPTQMTGTATVVPGKPGGGPGGPGGPPSALQLSAKGTAFVPTKLTALSPNVTIHFSNQDAGIPHNVAVFSGPDATAPALFHGDLVTGPAAADYSFSLPGPGAYFFHCDVHPTQMTGTITLPG